MRGINSTAERGDASARDLPDHVRRAEWTQKSDQDLIAAIERNILFAGNVVGSVAKNLHDDIRGGKHGGAVGDDLRALLRILGIGIAGVDAGAGLYLHFKSRFGQRGEDGRYERDPPLPRINFFRHTNDHKALPVWRFWIAIPKIRSHPACIKRSGGRLPTN